MTKLLTCSRLTLLLLTLLIFGRTSGLVSQLAALILFVTPVDGNFGRRRFYEYRFFAEIVHIIRTHGIGTEVVVISGSTGVFGLPVQNTILPRTDYDRESYQIASVKYIY